MRDSKGRFIDGWSGKRNRPKGLKYILKNKNKASFSKGHIPWNKGTHIYNGGGFKKGQTAWNKGNKFPEYSEV